MNLEDEKLETGQWLILSLELWLIVALGLAVGVAGTFLYSRVVSLEHRVAQLERAGDAAPSPGGH